MNVSLLLDEPFFVAFGLPKICGFLVFCWGLWWGRFWCYHGPRLVRQLILDQVSIQVCILAHPFFKRWAHIEPCWTHFGFSWAYIEPFTGNGSMLNECSSELFAKGSDERGSLGLS